MRNILKMAYLAGAMGGGYSRTLPQNLLTSQHSLIDGFEVTTDFAGSMTTDSVNFVEGTQSINLVTASGVAGNFIKGSLSLDFSNVYQFRFHIFNVADANNGCSGGTLYFSHSNSNYTNGFSIAFSTPHPGWNLMILPKSAFTTLGDGNWNNPIYRVKFSQTGSSGKSANISWDNWKGGVLPVPTCHFCFDDGKENIYLQAYPIFKVRNIPATVFVVSGYLNGIDRLSISECAELYANNWDIGNHTRDHADLTSLSQADVQTELTDCQTVLDDNGWTRASKHVAYPGGAYNDTVIAGMVAAGMLTGRSVSNSFSYGEALPLNNNYYYQASVELTSTTSLASAKNIVDLAISRGLIAIFYGHSIVASGAGSGEWNTSDLEALLDYILSKTVQCLTISEIYNLLSGPITVHHK